MVPVAMYICIYHSHLDTRHLHIPSDDVQLSNESGAIEAIGYLEHIFRLAQPPRDLQQPNEPRTVVLVEPCCSLSHGQWKDCCVAVIAVALEVL